MRNAALVVKRCYVSRLVESAAISFFFFFFVIIIVVYLLFQLFF